MFQINVTMATKNRTIADFTLKRYFQSNPPALSKTASKWVS